MYIVVLFEMIFSTLSGYLVMKVSMKTFMKTENDSLQKLHLPIFNHSYFFKLVRASIPGEFRPQ